MISIHRIIFRRLLLAWFAVSLLVGGLAYYVELRKIDDAVIALATSQTRDFSPEQLDSAGEFVQHNFVVIEVFDHDGNRVREMVNPKYAQIKPALPPLRLGVRRDTASRHEKFTIGEETIVHISAPLKSKLTGQDGRFDGFFVVDRSMVAELKIRLWRTLATVLLAVLATTLLLYPLIISLNRNVLCFSHEVMKGNMEIASVLGEAIAKRDSDTGEHNFRVTLYALRLGETLGLPAIRIRHLILGAFLHDVGKIGIPDRILLKPDKLTADEFAIMRTHVALGVDIIHGSEWLQGACEVIVGHHEKYDGSGYPRGLKGEAIPLLARIFAIVDVFDALVSRRSYKAPLPLEPVLTMLEKKAGSHFDPQLLKHFIRIAPTLYAQIGQASDTELQSSLLKEASHYFLQTSIECQTAKDATA